VRYQAAFDGFTSQGFTLDWVSGYFDGSQDQDMEDITREIEVCFSGPVRMTQQFMPHLKTRKGALLINVSSGLKLCGARPP
jgi:short-subunit dehydrogenase involved in D-alanine esterification of teichoic acids